MSYSREDIERYALDYDEAAGMFIAEQIEHEEREARFRGEM